MNEMTAKDPARFPSRDNLPPGDPLSVVSICLDQETWEVFKLFADSAAPAVSAVPPTAIPADQREAMAAMIEWRYFL